jgi:hypothetical protein
LRRKEINLIKSLKNYLFFIYQSKMTTTEMLGELFLGLVIGFLVAIGILFAILLFLAVYIYHSIAWMTIGKKLKYKKSWLAWIPIANISMFFQMGGFHWAWVFLILIPVFGWIAILVLLIISMWRIFVDRGQPGWFSLGIIIPQVGLLLYLIAIGIVAWADKKKKKAGKRKKKKRKKK